MAATLPPMIDLRIKSLTNLSLKMLNSGSLFYVSKHFQPKLASVKQCLIPKPLLLCISIECLAYVKAQHNMSN